MDSEACTLSPDLRVSTDVEGQPVVFSKGQVSPAEFTVFFTVASDDVANTAVVNCGNIPRSTLERDVRVSVVVEVSGGPASCKAQLKVPLVSMIFLTPDNFHNKASTSYGTSTASVVFDVLAMSAPRFDSPIYDDGEVHLSVFKDGKDGEFPDFSFPCYNLKLPGGGTPVRFDLEGVTPTEYDGHFRYWQKYILHFPFD